jgi:hypothetical protein
MWRIFFRPRVMFLAGTMAALSPYLLWWKSGLPSYFKIQLNYVPAFIYAFGYLSFAAGTLAVGNRVAAGHGSIPAQDVDDRELNFLTMSLFVLILLQSTLIVAFVFKGIPLIDFILYGGDIHDVHDRQATSFVGQLGLQFVFVEIFMGFMLLKVVQKHLEGGFLKIASSLVVVSAILLILVMSLKRQGVFILAFTMLCGLSFFTRTPVRSALAVFALPMKRKIALAIGVLGLPASLWFMSAIGELRTGIHAGGTEIILDYLSFPLMNMERQCEEAGYGPGDGDLTGPLATLIPIKILGRANDPDQWEGPPRVVRNSPSGFYSSLHWYWGMPGVLLFAFACGVVAQYCWAGAAQSVFLLFAYSLMSWGLFSCHSYNHFLNLIFLPLPVFGFFCILKVFHLRKAEEPPPATAPPPRTGDNSPAADAILRLDGLGRR